MRAIFLDAYEYSRSTKTNVGITCTKFKTVVLGGEGRRGMVTGLVQGLALFAVLFFEK